MSVDVRWLDMWMQRTFRVIAHERDTLNELDREIGDADHGENLDRGMHSVVEEMNAQRPATLREALLLIATTLMSTVGGAAGPLYGTGFLRAARTVDEDATQLDAAGVAAVFDAIVQGITERGNAQVGEKTMVDAWAPAAEAANRSLAEGAQTREVIARAAQAAQRGASLTETMRATKGRASYLGERSVGHLDPGAVSSALILMQASLAADDCASEEAQ